jgi:hypothetical protein
VSYRPWLEERALRQMGGLPPEALDVLVRALARICEDPYDRLFSRAVQEDDPRERMAELGDLGFVEFTIIITSLMRSPAPRLRADHGRNHR